MPQMILTVQQNPEETVLIPYGRLAGPEVQLLAQEGQPHLAQAGTLTLDLDGIRFIDDAGVALLQRWLGQGLVLRGGSPFLKALLVAAGLERNEGSGP